MDWGKNKRNVTDFIFEFHQVAQQYDPPGLEALQVAWQQERQEQAAAISLPQTNAHDGSVLSLFIPRKGYFATPALIDLNILIYIAMVVSGVHFMTPDNESLIRWGANFRPVTLDDGWYRLITCCFLHIGLLHLLMNMYALLYIGVLLEPCIGTTRFTAAYLLCGIAASVNSLWWHDLTVSAGASGAIFGMYGIFLALLIMKVIEPAARKSLLTSIAIFVGYNLLNGMKGGIDNAAHIGGLAGGFIIGLAFAININKKEKSPGYSTIAIMTVIVIIASSFVYRSIPNDIPKYDEKMKDFARIEKLALEVYRLSEETSSKEMLFQIKDRGLYYWNESIELLHSMDKLSLPEILHERIKTLIKYCQLRKKVYELMYKAIEEGSDKYQQDIEGYNKQIEGIINGLKSK